MLVCESAEEAGIGRTGSVPLSTKDSKMKWYLNLVCYKEVVVEVGLRFFNFSIL